MVLDISSWPCSIVSAATELAKKIIFEAEINKGANGYVLVGTNPVIDRRVVVKFYYWGDGAHVEPKLLSQLASPNLLKVDDAAAIDEDYAYFVTPFCDGGDLDGVIERGGVGVRRAVDLLMDIASGASFIHANGFVHRDLKPSNIFCEADGKLVIGDFGSVVKKGHQGYADTSSRHTLLYRTPEEINNGRVYEQSDVYQLGVVLYQLLGGSLPYEERAWLTSKELAHQEKLSHPDNQIYAGDIIQRRICRGKLLDFDSLPPWCPPELLSLIRKCCKIEHTARFESVSALMTKINNIRADLPDWRPEQYPVLYRRHAKFRVLEDRGRYFIEKIVKSGTSWRRVHSLTPSSLEEAVTAAQRL